jgi:hypothetical protein
MRALLRLALLAVSLLPFAVPCAAEVIGQAVVVKPQVRAFPPSGEPPHDLVAKELIERGLKVSLTGKNAYLRAALNFQGVNVDRSLRGPQTFAFTASALLRGPGDVEIGPAGAASPSTVRLLLGKLWLALAPGSPPMDVESPDMVAGVKGTYLRVLVDPVVGTFVAVDEGSVTVRAKAGGFPVEVPAGYWILVPPGGLPRPPALLVPGGLGTASGLGVLFDDPPLLDGLEVSTEPPKRQN